MDREELGRKLLELRVRRHLSQRDVARSIPDLSRQTLSRIERGETPVSLEIFEELVRVYHQKVRNGRDLVWKFEDL